MIVGPFRVTSIHDLLVPTRPYSALPLLYYEGFFLHLVFRQVSISIIIIHIIYNYQAYIVIYE